VIIRVNAAKDAVRGWLHKQIPGPGYMHFNTDWDVAAFEQLTAERIQVEGEGAQKVRKWVPIPGRANERLDCRVYAYAALRGLIHMGTKLNRIADQVGAAITTVINAPTAADGDEEPDAPLKAQPASGTTKAPAPPPPSPPPAKPPTPRRSIAQRLA